MTTNNSNSSYGLTDIIYSTIASSNSTVSATNSISNNTITFKANLCRNCEHGHMEGGGCIQVFGQMATFASCVCKEYVPKDNLEFFKYKYERQNKDIK